MTQPTREEALAHFGVKGMRWGVRNEDDISSFSKKEYGQILANQPSKNKVEAAKSIGQHKLKMQAKFESNDPNLKTPITKKGWRPTKKQVAVAATGAAFVGLIAASYYTKDKSNLSISNISDLAGKRCTVDDFKALREGSIQRTLGTFGFTPQSWDRPELSFPPGHVFHRISMTAETAFGPKGTYCTTSKKELARYLATTEYGRPGDHFITWTSTRETKVPNLSTVVKTAQKALSETSSKRVSKKQALKWFVLQSGGSWDGNDPLISRFFDKLKEQGYSAIIDETDAGIYAENPLVWFDKQVASPKQAKKITEADILEAENTLTEIIHRK